MEREKFVEMKEKLEDILVLKDLRMLEDNKSLKVELKIENLLPSELDRVNSILFYEISQYVGFGILTPNYDETKKLFDATYTIKKEIEYIETKKTPGCSNFGMKSNNYIR